MSPLSRICLLAVLAPVLWQTAVLQAGTSGTAVGIAKRDCQRLDVHVPDPGVAYQSGVDVRGRAVAPADLGGAPRLALPEIIVIDIDVDLEDRFGFPAKADSFEADARVGVVEVAPDGSARFNGQPLQEEAQSELTRRCQETLYGRP